MMAAVGAFWLEVCFWDWKKSRSLGRKVEGLQRSCPSL